MTIESREFLGKFSNLPCDSALPSLHLLWAKHSYLICDVSNERISQSFQQTCEQLLLLANILEMFVIGLNGIGACMLWTFDDSDHSRLHGIWRTSGCSGSTYPRLDSHHQTLVSDGLKL